VVKRLLPAVIAVAALASTVYTLTLLDQVVHGTLYSYGLQFSYNWANPYWTLLRVTMALLAISAVATIFNTILIVRLGFKEKQRSVKIPPTQKVMKNTSVTTLAREKTPTASHAPSPQASAKPTTKPTHAMTPTTSYNSPHAPESFKCAHCNKMFTQPLRMLDFQSDPPRIVNVCPFCNKTMSSAPTNKESEQTENKKSLFKNNNNNVQKPLAQ